MKQCYLCLAGDAKGPSSPVIKGVAVMAEKLKIPLDGNKYSFCDHCLECLRQIYEDDLKIRVLQTRMGERFQDIRLAIAENGGQKAPLAAVFIEKYGKYRAGRAFPNIDTSEKLPTKVPMVSPNRKSDEGWITPKTPERGTKRAKQTGAKESRVPAKRKKD